MTTISEVTTGDIFASSFNGSGTGITNLPLSGIATMTASYALQTNGSGIITAVQYLPNTMGGTGVNSSAFTGVAKVAAGVWSASAIADVDIGASAAIAFTKMAALTASSIVVTDGSGFITVTGSPLGLALGGTGLN